MLKDYLSQNGMSIYKLAKKCSISYSTLNDLANGKVKIDNCRLGMIRILASELDVSIEELVEICTLPEMTVSSEISGDITIQVKGKNYYASFEYNGTPVSLEICRISEESSFYIDEIAKWRADKYTRMHRMEDYSWNTI